MKKMRISSVAALTLCVFAEASKAEELTAAQVLAKSRAAYAGLKSYVGTTQTWGTMTFEGGRKLSNGAIARIQFERPSKLRIEGVETGEDRERFTIVSNPQKTWRRWSVVDAKKFETDRNAEGAVASMTGVFHGAPTTIPALLMPFDWHFPFRPNAKATLLGREEVRSADCYKILKVTPTRNVTYWIDSETFLLRRTKATQTLKQVSLSMKQIEKHRGRPLAGSRPTGSSDIEDYIIESVNSDLLDSLFQDPTKK